MARRKIRAKATNRRGKLRSFALKATVERAHSGGFYSCVRVGFGKSPTVSQFLRQESQCAFGRNPRVAVAAALSKYVKTLRKRSGAFRGL